MRAKQGGFAVLAAGALVVLALGAERAAAGTAPKDEVFCAKAMATQRLEAIAMLPPVAVVDNLTAESAVARGWMDLCGETTARWLAADDVLARLKTADSQALATEAEAEVWLSGAVTPAMAARLARVLGVDAVLSIRIDRWEVVDGGRGTVAMTATLTGATGARLWSIAGRAEHGAGLKSSEANFNPDMTVFWDPKLDPRFEEERLGIALYALLARWSPELPAPLYQDGQRTPMLAGEPDQPGTRR